MKTFYLKTAKFWVFSRILFTLLFTIALIIVSDFNFGSGNIVFYLIFGIYISSMITILVRRASKRPVPSAVEMIAGIISLLLGFLMSYTILINPNFSELQKIGYQVVPIWMILLGWRDILLHQNIFSNENI